MSNKNYDVEKKLTYSNTYRHYIPTYHVAIPYYWFDGAWYNYEAFVSFDDGSETDVTFKIIRGKEESPAWNDSEDSHAVTTIPDTGVFSKVYFRNPHRGSQYQSTTFTPSNCLVGVLYNTKAPFEIQFNSVGFVSNQNAWFKCSTVPKSTYAQYEWTSATVYYKKSTESSYQTATGVVSGTWSDVRIDTDINFEDGYTYNVYIRARGDDGTYANTSVGSFTTTDAPAVATCISPAGAFTNGEVTFVWAHSTEYGTAQYAYDLQYSTNNGASWTVVESHNVTQNTTKTVTLTDAGVYRWRVRTYNSNDEVGEWAEASFVNNGEATPAVGLAVDQKGRPTVSWASTSQNAYQVQFLLSGSVVYDSGAVYSPQTVHFVNQYFNDERSYVVRVRLYNSLGDVSDWVEAGYQQQAVSDVLFDVEANPNGGASITVHRDNAFLKYYLLRNGRPIAEIKDESYVDKFAIGTTNYSVVGVTPTDQSDIQEKNINIAYPSATIIALDGEQILVNKRVDNEFEIQTSNSADFNASQFIGDRYSTHYPSDMRLKSFTVNCFDDRGFCEKVIGNMVFYADNFGNGGYCIVTNYTKTDSFIKNSQGVYANETTLTLEVTNYDDSIEYPV